MEQEGEGQADIRTADNHRSRPLPLPPTAPKPK